MDAESRRFHALAEAGELAAAVPLVQAQRARLEGLLLRRYGRVLGQVDVELAVDEALGRALDFCERFDPGRGTLGAWLETIAENCARNALAERRPRACSDGAEELVSPVLAERLDALQLALAALPREERLILRGRYFQRSAFDDTRLGRWLGCTRGHVHNRRSAILKRLRRVLERLDG